MESIQEVCRSGGIEMIFDAHGDVWTDVTTKTIDHGERDIIRRHHLEKFKEGGVMGGIFVIWIDPPYDKDPVARARQIVTSIKKEMAVSTDIVRYVTKFEDFAKAQQEGKLAIVTGMEGLSEIGTDLNQIDYYYNELGVRHAMLTWNELNDLATGWPVDVTRGLTTVGKEAVKHIQDLGMVMDVSHLNDKCFWDVMNLAQGPIIASHSNARSVCPAMRNLSDEMLKEVAKTGGVVGMNSMREFVDEDVTNQDVEHLVNHIDHIADLIGIKHIGLGFDFDDYLDDEALTAFSTHIESPSCVRISNEREAKNVLVEMKNRGYSQSDLDAVGYGNFFRVFKEVWK